MSPQTQCDPDKCWNAAGSNCSQVLSKTSGFVHHGHCCHKTVASGLPLFGMTISIISWLCINLSAVCRKFNFCFSSLGCIPQQIHTEFIYLRMKSACGIYISNTLTVYFNNNSKKATFHTNTESVCECFSTFASKCFWTLFPFQAWSFWLDFVLIWWLTVWLNAICYCDSYSQMWLRPSDLWKLQL